MLKNLMTLSLSITALVDEDINKDEDDNSILGYLEDDSVNNFIVKISSSDTISVVKCYERTFKSEEVIPFLGLL